MRERTLRLAFLFCALGSIMSILLIFLFVTVRGFGVFATHGISNTLLSFDWQPLDGKFGMLPFITGTFIVTIGALLLGAPLAIGTAIFLSEMASPTLKAVVRPSVELLAGIPSVVYGFFGLVFLVPLVRGVFGGSGFGVLTGVLILAIMILPTITAISEDAIAAVPRSLRAGSLALGATRWQTIRGVVLPAASSGIVNAVILGMGRALGETMAVLMVLGNAPIIPKSLSTPASTLTSIIALDMSYAAGEHQVALFAMGIVLLLLSMLLIVVVRLVTYRRAQ